MEALTFVASTITSCSNCLPNTPFQNFPKPQAACSKSWIDIGFSERVQYNSGSKPTGRGSVHFCGGGSNDDHH